MRKLILLLLVCTASKSVAATITIFPDDNGLCRYIFMDDNANQIATWTHDCLADYQEVKSVDIVKNTPLWKALKKLDASASLREVKLRFAKSGPTIAELRVLSVREIDAGKRPMARSFRVHDESLEKQRSKDYNSSRSNKANSMAPAQDYNSSRSNKANLLAPAQDYNSSRSNKANSVVPAQDYNSSRSNKANSIAPAQDYNSSRSNKANSMAPAQDYNSSRSNKANSIASAQDYNSSRSNKAGVMLALGLTRPHQTEYIKHGVTIRGAYHIPLMGGWGVEAGVDFYSNPFVYKPSPYLPEKYRLALESGISNEKWSQIAISGGPSFTEGCGK